MLGDEGRTRILDDLVPEELYAALLVAGSRVRWQFGHKTRENPQSRYWHHDIGGGPKDNVEDIGPAIETHPLKIFARYRDWLRGTLFPDDVRILRFYLNGHTFGTDGWPHRDTERDGELSVILYLTPMWKPEWCGETAVFDEEGDLETAVLPRRNRLFIFPSEKLHAPRPLPKAFPGLRIVLVAKVASPRQGEPILPLLG